MVTIKINRDYINILHGSEDWEWWKKQKGVIVDEENGIIDTGVEMIIDDTPVYQARAMKKKIRIHASYINKKLNKKENTA